MIKIALDISTKKTGVAVFKDQQVRQALVIQQYVYHGKLNGMNVLFKNTDIFVNEMNKIKIKYQVVDEIVTEISCIPSNSGRQLVFYVGWFLSAIRPIGPRAKIKLIPVYEWQRRRLGVDVVHQRGHTTKKKSIELAVEYTKATGLYKKLIEENDDIADAINIGVISDECRNVNDKSFTTKYIKAWEKKRND